MSYFQDEMQRLAEAITQLTAAREQIDALDAAYMVADKKFRSVVYSLENRWFSSFRFIGLESGADLRPVFTALRAIGYHLRKNAKVDKESLEIVWEFYHKDNDHSLTVHGGIKSEAAKCRRVQIGTKTTEVPIFEIQCEGPAQALFDSVSATDTDGHIPSPLADDYL